ncbi:hypothetical protein RJD24_02635 [Bacillaceae bacterium IKA-2]|nr:hypothetical protein RJD24_02635 [Bacillaceae bacterium IKA-2]
MKSGHINQYSHLSEFTSIPQFNETVKQQLKKHSCQLTKGELLAFTMLTRFSVKKVGICNARICKLVAAAQSEKGGISRSTFERMLRKANQLGILTIHHTTRKKGGYSHNVYVFHRFDGTQTQKLTERPQPKNPAIASVQNPKTSDEAISFKTKIKDQELRPITIETLDYTFVPSYVPSEFTRIVKSFFSRAKDICQFWDRALMVYRSLKFEEPIEYFLPIIIKAFKETVYHYKRKMIKTSFIAYYYGTLAGMLTVERRKIFAKPSRLSKWMTNAH